MPSYLNPKIDLAFKLLFGKHADLLKSFLNALLPLPEDAPIETLEYLSNEQTPRIPYIEKNSIVDVKCKDTKGRHFIVEMQMRWRYFHDSRFFFNACKAYVDQLPDAAEYNLLQPVYALIITNDIIPQFGPDNPDYYHRFQVVNAAHPAEIIKDLELIFIELPKFKAEDALLRRDLRRLHIDWLRFLKEVDAEQHNIDPALLEQPEIREAVRLMEVGSFTREEREAYNTYLDAARCAATFKADLNKAEEKGREKGREEGRIEGKLETATHLLPLLDDASIVKATGLTLNQVSALRRKECGEPTSFASQG